MPWSTSRLVALLVASCFAAGLNVYATVATLGLLARTQAIDLPPSLDLVTSWWVIGASVTLYAIEFVADKIPAIDLIWNAFKPLCGFRSPRCWRTRRRPGCHRLNNCSPRLSVGASL